MRRRIRTQIVVAFAAISLLLSTAVPAEAGSTQRVKTVVAKERIGKRVEGLLAISGESVSSGQIKVILSVKSKTVTNVDQISITYSCPDDSPEGAVSRAKWSAPRGGVDLPARLVMRLPADSESCYLSGAVSAPWTEREGPMTMKLVTVGRG